MSTHTTDRTAASRPSTLIVQRHPGAPFVLQARRPWDAVLARLLAPWLDERLARGASPESTRLFAARAAQLVDPRARRSLADAWDRLLDRASQPRTVVDPRIPVARGEVQQATAEIAALSAALRSSRPIAVGDVARAQDLLTDGLGPVYRPGLCLRADVANLVADLEK